MLVLCRAVPPCSSSSPSIHSSHNFTKTFHPPVLSPPLFRSLSLSSSSSLSLPPVSSPSHASVRSVSIRLCFPHRVLEPSFDCFRFLGVLGRSGPLGDRRSLLGFSGGLRSGCPCSRFIRALGDRHSATLNRNWLESGSFVRVLG